MQATAKSLKFFKIIIYILIVLILVISGAVIFWLYQDRLTPKKEPSPAPTVAPTLTPASSPTSPPKPEQSPTNEISGWQTHSDSKAGFTYKSSPDLTIGSTIPSTFKQLNLTVSSQNISDLPEQAPMGLGRSTTLQDQQALAQGQYGQEIDWALPSSKKVRKLNGINAKEFMVLQRFEVCDVTFERKLIFFKDNYQITFTLYGPKDDIIANSPQFFTFDQQQGCANDFIWKQSGPIAFYQNLANQTASIPAQNWYNTFDQIVSTISF